MKRLGYIHHNEAFAGAVDMGPVGRVFGQSGKSQAVSLWDGADWSLHLPSTSLPPWNIVVEAMSVQAYDGTTQPGYPISGQWYEFGVILDPSTYMPIYAGYTDDAGRLRWNGQIHSHRGIILVIGNNAVTALDSLMLRFQALYTEEVGGAL